MKDLLEGLGREDAYPHPADGLEVVQTHISAVFLAGPYAYKLKKPVDFGFVDFGTLERRRRFCYAEVRLNRRLAPSVYHGVVPVLGGPGGPRIPADILDPDPFPPDGPADALPDGEPGPEVVEWAVRMERLPESRTLKQLLRTAELEGEAAVAFMERLARLLADFHARAERGEAVSAKGGFDTVAGNARENFDELENAVGVTVSRTVLDRLREASESELARLRPLMEDRERRNVPCDTHGDLRLGHVYHLEDDTPDGRIVIVDCVEFNDRFRYADPVADIAFLDMELELEGWSELARTFSRRWLDAADEDEGAELLPYYTAYRDVVRGKVRGLAAGDETIGEGEREKARRQASRHLLRALVRLAPPAERPALVLVAGLPGVGKSVLGRALSREAGFTWIDTDRVRRVLAGGWGEEGGGTAFEEGIYTPEWTERTYQECRRRARSLLFEGARVVVEGSFRAEAHRAAFLEVARERGVPALLLICRAEPGVVRERLVRRRREADADQASEAGWRVYREMAERWEPPASGTAAAARVVRTDGSRAEALGRALEILRAEALLPS